MTNYIIKDKSNSSQEDTDDDSEIIQLYDHKGLNKKTTTAKNSNVGNRRKQKQSQKEEDGNQNTSKSQKNVDDLIKQLKIDENKDTEAD